MQQIDDVAEQKNVFSNRSRFGMFLLLSAIAGSAIVFEAKEQQAEDKVRTSMSTKARIRVMCCDRHAMLVHNSPTLTGCVCMYVCLARFGRLT
jgi:hypothetical protein